jgi:hypothetical protein
LRTSSLPSRLARSCLVDARAGLHQVDIEIEDFVATSSDHTLLSTKESTETQTNCKGRYGVAESLATDWRTGNSRTMRRLSTTLYRVSEYMIAFERTNTYLLKWEGEKTNNRKRRADSETCGIDKQMNIYYANIKFYVRIGPCR